jgi:hypothetical protein
MSEPMTLGEYMKKHGPPNTKFNSYGVPAPEGVTAEEYFNMKPNPRKHLLDTAESLVNGDRNVQYGDPNEDFKRIAKMWSILLGVEVKPEQVAMCMIAMKLSRLVWTPGKEDSWVDIAGYAACGWDVVSSADPS